MKKWTTTFKNKPNTRTYRLDIISENDLYPINELVNDNDTIFWQPDLADYASCYINFRCSKVVDISDDEDIHFTPFATNRFIICNMTQGTWHQLQDDAQFEFDYEVGVETTGYIHFLGGEIGEPGDQFAFGFCSGNSDYSTLYDTANCYIEKCYDYAGGIRIKDLDLIYDDPVEIRYNGDNDIFKAIKISSCEINILTGIFDNDMLPNTYDSVKVNITDVTDLANPTIVWKGYMTTDTVKQPYNDTLNVITLNAVDALSNLKNKSFKHSSFEFKSMDDIAKAIDNFKSITYPSFNFGDIYEYEGVDGIPARYYKADAIYRRPRVFGGQIIWDEDFALQDLPYDIPSNVKVDVKFSCESVNASRNAIISCFNTTTYENTTHSPEYVSFLENDGFALYCNKYPDGDKTLEWRSPIVNLMSQSKIYNTATTVETSLQYLCPGQNDVRRHLFSDSTKTQYVSGLYGVDTKEAGARELFDTNFYAAPQIQPLGLLWNDDYMSLAPTLDSPFAADQIAPVQYEVHWGSLYGYYARTSEVLDFTKKFRSGQNENQMWTWHTNLGKNLIILPLERSLPNHKITADPKYNNWWDSDKIYAKSLPYSVADSYVNEITIQTVTENEGEFEYTDLYHFVPCLDSITGLGGVYDTVNGAFYAAPEGYTLKGIQYPSFPALYKNTFDSKARLDQIYVPIINHLDDSTNSVILFDLLEDLLTYLCCTCWIEGDRLHINRVTDHLLTDENYLCYTKDIYQTVEHLSSDYYNMYDFYSELGVNLTPGIPAIYKGGHSDFADDSFDITYTPGYQKVELNTNPEDQKLEPEQSVYDIKDYYSSCGKNYTYVFGNWWWWKDVQQDDTTKTKVNRWSIINTHDQFVYQMANWVDPYILDEPVLTDMDTFLKNVTYYWYNGSSYSQGWCLPQPWTFIGMIYKFAFPVKIKHYENSEKPDSNKFYHNDYTIKVNMSLVPGLNPSKDIWVNQDEGEDAILLSGGMIFGGYDIAFDEPLYSYRLTTGRYPVQNDLVLNFKCTFGKTNFPDNSFEGEDTTFKIYTDNIGIWVYIHAKNTDGEDIYYQESGYQQGYGWYTAKRPVLIHLNPQQDQVDYDIDAGKYFVKKLFNVEMEPKNDFINDPFKYEKTNYKGFHIQSSNRKDKIGGDIYIEFIGQRMSNAGDATLIMIEDLKVEQVIEIDKIYNQFNYEAKEPDPLPVGFDTNTLSLDDCNFENCHEHGNTIGFTYDDINEIIPLEKISTPMLGSTSIKDLRIQTNQYMYLYPKKSVDITVRTNNLRMGDKFKIQHGGEQFVPMDITYKIYEDTTEIAAIQSN